MCAPQKCFPQTTVPVSNKQNQKHLLIIELWYVKLNKSRKSKFLPSSKNMVFHYEKYVYHILVNKNIASSLGDKNGPFWPPQQRFWNVLCVQFFFLKPHKVKSKTNWTQFGGRWLIFSTIFRFFPSSFAASRENFPVKSSAPSNPLLPWVIGSWKVTNEKSKKMSPPDPHPRVLPPIHW